MSDKVYVGQKANKVENSPSYLPYSKVVIIAGEDENGVQNVYEAGDDSGLTLEVSNPWGSQQIADDMLARISGYEYRPFYATGALINPAAELGDAITVNGIYSVLASEDTVFSALYSSDIAAPSDGEIDHEYPYEASGDREIARKFAGLRTSLRVNYDSIIAQIEDLENDVDTQFSVMNGEIASRITTSDAQTLVSQSINGITISAVGGSNQSTVTIRSNGIYVDSAVVQFTNIVADSIVANSRITAPLITGGTISGASIISEGKLGSGETYGLYIDSTNLDFRSGGALYGRITIGEQLGRLSIYSGNRVNIGLYADGQLTLSGGYGTYAEGDWDFSDANVIGLTAAAVFG